MTLFRILLCLLPVAGANAKVVDDLKIARKCHHSIVSKAQYNCEYKIGSKLDVEIAGVGSNDASVYFNHADNTNYFVKFGVRHQCVIITGADSADLAFISVADGKIYSDWTTCRQSNRRRK